MDILSAVHAAFIASLLLSVVRLITGQVTTPPSVSATEGDSAVITCQFDPTALVGVEWKRGADQETAATVLRIFRTRLIPSTDKRFNLTSDYSLTISETRLNDSDIYWCQVSLGGLFRSSTNFTVSPGKEFTSTIAPASAITSNPAVRPTTPKATTNKQDQATKPDPNNIVPDKLTGGNTTLIIIVVSCGAAIIIPLLILLIYCCCCKKRAPKGYNPPKPV